METTSVNLHVIYLRSDGMLLSKRHYASWQAIQDDYDAYVASLGPWCVEDVRDYLLDEYPNLSPPVEEQLSAFLASPDETFTLTFGLGQ